MNYCFNNTKTGIRAATLLLGAGIAANADTFVIEPDNYSAHTIINHIIPQVSLFQAMTDNSVLQFNLVTAIPDSQDGYPHVLTGNQLFGTGVDFWNNTSRLRMNFTAPVQSVSLLFGGGDLGAIDTGELDAFDSSGALIASATSSPLAAGNSQTLSVGSTSDSIAWAVAYFPANSGTFGRLDHLEFSTVPEPSTCALLAAALGLLSRRHNARGRC